MKNTITYLSFLFVTFLCCSCEDVVDVDLETAPPKLVIDASIDWVKGTDGSSQKIKLSTTTGFYSTQIPTVSGASVQVTNSANTVFNFVETPGTGEYVCTNFAPVIGETYALTVTIGGQTYTATEKMIAAPDIDNIEQKNDSGFGGDEIEIKFFFQDNGSQDNYYMTGFKADINVYPYFGVFDDEFFQGNQTFASYTNEDLAAGNQMQLSLYGISRSYHDYMGILLNVSQGDGGPWSSTPTNVRGNIVNQSNAANFALGYFRLCEVDKADYTVQ